MMLADREPRMTYAHPHRDAVWAVVTGALMVGSVAVWVAVFVVALIDGAL